MSTQEQKGDLIFVFVANRTKICKESTVECSVHSVKLIEQEYNCTNVVLKYSFHSGTQAVVFHSPGGNWTKQAFHEQIRDGFLCHLCYLVGIQMDQQVRLPFFSQIMTTHILLTQKSVQVALGHATRPNYRTRISRAHTPKDSSGLRLTVA